MATAGSGLLLGVILAVVAILAVLAFGQSSLTSSVSAEADVLVRGDRAEALASAAVHEALARVRRQANTPGTEVFERLRRTVQAPDTGRCPLTDCLDVPETRALAQDETYVGCDLEGPTVDVVEQRHLDGTDYERCGVVRFVAVARSVGRLGRGVVRRVEVVVPFKTVLACSPRPFCLGGVFVAGGDETTDLEALRGLRTGFLAANEALWTVWRDVRSTAPASMAEKYALYEGRLVPQAQAVERTPPVTGEGEAMVIGCFYDGADFYLSSLDTAAYLATHAATLREAERVIGTTAAAAKRTMDVEVHEAFIAAAEGAAATIEDALFRIWASRAMFRYVTRDDPFFEKFRQHLYKFDASYWQRRIQYRVSPRPGEPDCMAAWKRFLEDHPRPSGVIAIDNGTEVFRLDGTVHGTAVLVVGPGGVHLENVNRDEASDDVLTVVATAGPVRLRGENHCSLFLVRGEGTESPDLDLDDGTTLHGNLHMWRPPHRPLRGTLVRHEKYSSGITLDGGREIIVQSYLHVAMAPQVLYRKVSRQ